MRQSGLELHNGLLHSAHLRQSRAQVHEGEGVGWILGNHLAKEPHRFVVLSGLEQEVGSLALLPASRLHSHQLLQQRIGIVHRAVPLLAQVQPRPVHLSQLAVGMASR